MTCHFSFYIWQSTFFCPLIFYLITWFWLSLLKVFTSFSIFYFFLCHKFTKFVSLHFFKLISLSFILQKAKGFFYICKLECLSFSLFWVTWKIFFRLNNTTKSIKQSNIGWLDKKMIETDIISFKKPQLKSF